MTYRLPPRYRRNTHPVPFDDHAPIVGQCAGWEWQPDVYPFAAGLAAERGADTLIDIGCGAARKLREFADRFDLIGLDRAEIVRQIDAPGTYAAIDLESPHVEIPVAGRPVLICSDVIEHLVSPENALLAMAEALRSGALALGLSTPDRSRSRWTRRLGPPSNRGHVQEWTLDELAAWCTDLGFTVVSAGHTRSNDHEPDEATCLLVLESA